MNRILKNEVLTKEKLIELLQEAKQDRNGHWYVEMPQDKIGIDFGLNVTRVYFGMFYTVCADFVKEFAYICSGSTKNTEHYNRHFINDDTFELFVAKNIPEVKE